MSGRDAIADATAELDRACTIALGTLDPALAALLTRRVESLVAGEAPAGEGSSELERACLALADRFVADVPGVTGELTEPVRRLLGDDGLYGLAWALYAVDARARLRVARERVLG